MSFLNTYFVLVLLLLWPLQSNSYSGAEKFNPEKYIPVEHHFIPNCGSGPDPVPEVSDDYYENYDDDDDDSGGREQETPVCPNDTNPPTIWILEDGTRFMNSLKHGHKSSMSEGLLDIRGILHDTGACYRFVSLEDNLSVEQMTDLIIGLVKENKIRTILLIVEYDQLETLPESSSLIHQMRIIQYLLGDKTFENIFLIVGHPFERGDKTAKREAEDTFSKMFKWPPEDIESLPMSNSLNLYGDIFKEKQIKNAIDGSLVSIENGNQPPLLLSDMGTKIEQTMFYVTSFFSASEVETWQLDWLLGGNLFWRIEGHSEGVISAEEKSVEGVIETNQEVTHITKNLYAAKVWIMPKGQKNMTIDIDVSAKMSSISVSVSAWKEWEAWSGCNIYLEKTRKRQTENEKEEQKEKEKCDITSLTEPNFCQRFKYPSPRILFLGATGVGKSTIGNMLLGVSKGKCLKRGRCIECRKGYCKPGQCVKEDSKGVCEQCRIGQCKRIQGACIDRECVKRKNYKLGNPMPETEELPFEPGSGIDSKTLKTKTFNGQFLGSGPCVTLIDTPGAADTKGRDYEHAIKMAKFLKNEMGSFDAILLMLKGSDRRFSSHTIALLKLYQEIFGKEMWRNVIVEMSYWKHTEQAACDRKKDMSLDELKQQQDINRKLREEFDVKHTVPIVFIDPVFGGFDPNQDVEKREVDVFQNQTISLWKIVKEMNRYECSENCQAPEDFYTGTPWLESATKTKVEDGQANFVVPCKIWDGITSGDSSHKNSDMMKWFFRGEEMFSQDYGMDPIFNTEILESYGFEIVPPKSSRGSLFAISTLTIERVNGKQHHGVFMCKNKKGQDEWKLSIPFWSEWGAWSQCTKSCRTYDPPEPPGKQKRTRECEGHENEVNTCSSSQGGEEEVRDCKIDVFCPVEPVVTDWSTWTSCSPSCGEGSRSRSRTCTPGRFNLIKKYDMCPTKNNVLYDEKKEICTNGPCPKNCKFSEWSDWGRCKPECAKDTNVKGQKKRYRSVLEQAIGNGTCDATEDARSCKVTECPVDGKWGEWHKGTCISSIGCGKGRQDKWRSCEGRKGAGKLCRTSNGFESEYEPKNEECFTKACPVDCVLGPWSYPSCTASCDSHSDVTMSRSVIKRAKNGGMKCDVKSKSFRCYGHPCPLPATHTVEKIVYRDSEGGCYSRNSLVTLSKGNSVKMSSLKIGDNVEISDENGVHGFSEFVGWMEKDKTLKASFYKLTSESGNELVMTGSHGLFIEKDGIVSATFAQYLDIGDSLILSNQRNGTKTERLVLISMVTETGWLDPLTRSGTIMVNNISTSCYASFPHWLANLALLPARQWPEIFFDDAETQEKDGTREYIHFIKHVGRLFSSSGFRMDDKYSEASEDVGLIKHFERAFSFPNLRIGDKNLQETGVTIVWLSLMAGCFGIFLQHMYKK